MIRTKPLIFGAVAYFMTFVSFTVGQTARNGVYLVDQWCSVAGQLDDTCFSRAIADLGGTQNVPGKGPLSLPGPVNTGVLIVPPGTYHFNNTVTIPPNMSIAIRGQQQAGVWGSMITAASNGTPVDFFHVEAQNISIDHLSFYGTITNANTNAASTGITAITLGNKLHAERATDDVHINWCWFNGVGVGIHIVNGSGYDLSHNTFDSGVSYGIYSNANEGDLMAKDIIATDIRGYDQTSTITINGGSQNTNYQGYIVSGVFDNSAGVPSAPIALSNVINATISGLFLDNYFQDISITGSSGITISNFQVYNPGQTSIYITTSNGVHISNGVFYNSGVNQYGAPLISITKSGSPTVTGLTAIDGGNTHANIGLYIDSNTSGSTVSGNNFSTISQPYSVNDPSASFNVVGALSAGSVSAGNGFNGSKTIGSCHLTVMGGIITSISGC